MSGLLLLYLLKNIIMTDDIKPTILEELQKQYDTLGLKKSVAYLSTYSDEQLQILLNICNKQPVEVEKVCTITNEKIMPHLVVILVRHKRYDEMLNVIAKSLEHKLRPVKISQQSRIYFFDNTEFSKNLMPNLMECNLCIVMNFLTKYYKYSYCKKENHTDDHQCCKTAAFNDIEHMCSVIISGDSMKNRLIAKYIMAMVLIGIKNNLNRAISYLTQIIADPLQYLKVAATFELALIYHRKLDYEKAKKHYIQLVKDHEHLPSMINLGKIYTRTGRVKSAEKIYIKAISSGNVDAMFSLGMLCKENKYSNITVIKYLKMAADRGNEEAIYQLGMFYAETAHDDKKALKYLTMAKNKNHKLASTSIDILERKIVANIELGASHTFNYDNFSVFEEDKISVMKDLVISMQNVTQTVRKNDTVLAQMDERIKRNDAVLAQMEEKLQNKQEVEQLKSQLIDGTNKLLLENADIHLPIIISDPVPPTVMPPTPQDTPTACAPQDTPSIVKQVRDRDEEEMKRLNNELIYKKRKLNELLEMKKSMI